LFLDSFHTRINHQLSQFLLDLPIQQRKRLPQSTCLLPGQLNSRLNSGGIVMRLEEFANGPSLRPKLPPTLQIALNRDSIPQFHRQLRNDIRRTPDGTRGTRRQPVEGKSIPAVERSNLVRKTKHQLRKCGSIARGIFEI